MCYYRVTLLCAAESRTGHSPGRPDHFHSGVTVVIYVVGNHYHVMSEDIENRIVGRFERRIEGSPDVSRRTVHALLDGQGDDDFGSDDELLETIVGLDR